jgi:hypothetical protein
VSGSLGFVSANFNILVNISAIERPFTESPSLKSPTAFVTNLSVLNGTSSAFS